MPASGDFSEHRDRFDLAEGLRELRLVRTGQNARVCKGPRNPTSGIVARGLPVPSRSRAS